MTASVLVRYAHLAVLLVSLTAIQGTTAKAAHAPNAADASERASSPNFVFFLVDDLGWRDLSCFGSEFHETPRIDALAASGMMFTDGYAACPVCSPTRASLMTGRHPVRVDITDWIPGARAGANEKLVPPEDRDELALDEVTIAELLQQHGYQTFFAGKWHLGSEGYWPTDQGFDINIGGCEKGSPPGGYYAPWSNPMLEAQSDDEYLTERLTEESCKFLAGRDPARPFFLYLSYYNVHTPVVPYEKRIEHYREKAERMFEGETPMRQEHDGVTRLRQDRPDFASMVAAVDDSVGTVLQQLADLELDESTVVIFFSDNGGLSTLGPRRNPSTSNVPLRAGKGWLYEGGVRVPMIVRAPGVTTPGSVCETPVVSMDFFPTILELAGLAPRPELHADGVSLAPLLAGRPLPEQRALFWHYPHYHGSTWEPGASIRDGRWKLIEFYDDDKVELYDLASDLSETQDLADAQPERRDALRAKLRRWQKTMGAKMPTVRQPE